MPDKVLNMRLNQIDTLANDTLPLKFLQNPDGSYCLQVVSAGGSVTVSQQAAKYARAGQMDIPGGQPAKLVMDYNETRRSGFVRNQNTNDLYIGFTPDVDDRSGILLQGSPKESWVVGTKQPIYAFALTGTPRIGYEEEYD